MDIKDFIEEKKKEYEEKFCVFEGTDFKNNPMNPQLIWQWFSQSLQSAYEKGVADGANIDKDGLVAHLFDRVIEQQKEIDGE